MTTNTQLATKFQFQAPTSIAMYAPPQSGKTTLTKKILLDSDKLFTLKPHKIIYCYNEYLPTLSNFEHELHIPLITHQGIPTIVQLEEWSNGEHYIIVMDDLQQVCERNRVTSDMFTVGSSHMNFSIIYLCHQLFNKGNFSRTISLNCHYLILFRNNRDKTQVELLGRQIFGSKMVEYFVDAFEKATKNPWGYLLINNHVSVREEKHRLFTNILSYEPTTVFVPRKRT